MFRTGADNANFPEKTSRNPLTSTRREKVGAPNVCARRALLSRARSRRGSSHAAQAFPLHENETTSRAPASGASRLPPDGLVEREPPERDAARELAADGDLAFGREAALALDVAKLAFGGSHGPDVA